MVEREVVRGLLPEDGGTEVEEAVMSWFEREVEPAPGRSAERPARVIWFDA